MNKSKKGIINEYNDYDNFIFNISDNKIKEKEKEKTSINEEPKSNHNKNKKAIISEFFD